MRKFFTLLVKRLQSSVLSRQSMAGSQQTMLTTACCPAKNTNKTGTSINDATLPFASFLFIKDNKEQTAKGSKEQVTAKKEQAKPSAPKQAAVNPGLSVKDPGQKKYDERSWVNDDMAHCDGTTGDYKKNSSVNDAMRSFASLLFYRNNSGNMKKTNNSSIGTSKTLHPIPHTFNLSFMKTFLPKSGVIAIALMIAGLFLANSLFSQTQTFNYTGSNQTFTVPAGVTKITVQVWGGGGCSGNNSDGRARGGGGGGAYTEGIISVTPGSDLTVVVGAGGVYNGSNTSTDDGGASSVGVIIANGGSRGVIGNNSVTNNGGAGGAASTDPGGVTSFLSFAGGNGGNGYVAGDNGGGGGGGESASSSGPGNNAANGTSGGAGGAGGTGNPGGGDGGRGADNNGSDSGPGITPGGGGGGRGDDNGTDRNGAPGRVTITWTVCPAITFTTLITDITCFNAGDGKITVNNVTGGTPTYTYSKDDGANYQASNVFDNLIPGSYKIMVKDANGCTSKLIQ